MNSQDELSGWTTNQAKAADLFSRDELWTTPVLTTRRLRLNYEICFALLCFVLFCFILFCRGLLTLNYALRCRPELWNSSLSSNNYLIQFFSKLSFTSRCLCRTLLSCNHFWQHRMVRGPLYRTSFIFVAVHESPGRIVFSERLPRMIQEGSRKYHLRSFWEVSSIHN